MPDAATEALASPSIFQGWTWDPLVMGLLLLSSGLYAHGLMRVWRRAGAGRGIRLGQAACFAVGMLVLVMALLSPLDGWSDLLFSAHMTQHELLMLVAAPLLVLGRPLGPVLGALPAGLRSRLVQGLRTRSVTSMLRRATAPMAVWPLNVGVLWVWHVPFLYEAALASEPVHWLQHASFLGAAGLFWWTLVEGRYGRAGYGVASLFVFVTALQGNVLAALLLFSPEAWYPSHRIRTPQWGLSALEDQQLAGLVLWVPAGVLLGLVALALFANWLGEIERRVLRREALAERRLERFSE